MFHSQQIVDQYKSLINLKEESKVGATAETDSYVQLDDEKGYSKQEDFYYILFVTETVDQDGNNAGATKLVKNMKKDLNSVQKTFQDNKNKLAQ